MEKGNHLVKYRKKYCGAICSSDLASVTDNLIGMEGEFKL